MLRCENVRIDGHSFDLSELGGPHSVVTSRWESLAETHFNTTYTVDICQPLKKSGKSKKGEECPNGTRVCAIERTLKDDTDMVTKVVAIAGGLENVGGTSFEYEATRLKTSDSNSDSKKEGVRLVLKGGKHPLSGPNKQRRPQQAVIEFLCDKEKTGLENEWRSEDRYDGDDGKKDSKAKRDDKKDGDENKGDDNDDGTESGVEHQLKKEGAALVWEGYSVNEKKDADVLRLTWYTKHACESREESGDDGESDNSSHWGFFTWMLIIAFLGVASYLIFGSWLNYSRYGARGWDLLPHGDTLRDIPYLVKDWTRSVLNTVQGAGSRGGYSAV
ncbi:autophagy-related protein 27 [Emericellopsis atlantica]|uniref:Autophagy-related protein 27 n=1 Tax=Emericellopsis atlantica TaxID=2614577 RepID=A0A9P7ZQ45_9HYPO|nr:autophagy-related protein 27 [Emericellopsis atlantica]KAG9256254.1 autophagy-related protein 27 [Emericellopsis atlantica]